MSSDESCTTRARRRSTTAKSLHAKVVVLEATTTILLEQLEVVNTKLDLVLGGIAIVLDKTKPQPSSLVKPHSVIEKPQSCYLGEPQPFDMTISPLAPTTTTTPITTPPHVIGQPQSIAANHAPLALPLPLQHSPLKFDEIPPFPFAEAVPAIDMSIFVSSHDEPADTSTEHSTIVNEHYIISYDLEYAELVDLSDSHMPSSYNAGLDNDTIIHTRIRVQRDCNFYEGQVIELQSLVDEDVPMYLIRYDDGDMEHFFEEQVKEYAIPMSPQRSWQSSVESLVDSCEAGSSHSNASSSHGNESGEFDREIFAFLNGTWHPDM